MNKITLFPRFILSIILPLYCIGFITHAFAHSAGIKLPQTRVIFNSKDKGALATIQNQGDNVYLVKASVLNEVNTSSKAVPFAVTPPLFRLEPHNQQTVRIVRQGNGSLPADRESVFYLSFLAIPSTTETSNTDNRVAIGLQTVIKLFYRPERLAMSSEKAATELTFQQQGELLIVSNPTPYYLTLGSVSVAGKTLPFGEAGQMIAPFSQATYPHSGHATAATWTVINDYGGISAPNQATISKQKVTP